MAKKVNAPGLIVLLSAICLASIASAQTSWWRTYGGTAHDLGHSAQQTTDGGYVVTGATSSFGQGTPTYDNVYLIKTNAQGETLWTRAYGGLDIDAGYDVQQTSDGGYVVAGYTYAFLPRLCDVYFLKTNSQGDTLWTRTYGGTSYDGGRSVRQTIDGGYIIAGFTFSFGAETTNVYLIKTNADGDTLWTRTYGGASFDYGASVQQTTDGGYIVAGTTSSFGSGDNDVYLIRTSAMGDTLWTRTYGGTGRDRGWGVQQTADSGYIVAGSTSSFGAGSDDFYLIKTDASGNTLWTKTYGGPDNDQGGSVRQTTDGGYVVTGWTESFGPGTPDSDNVYLVKTDASGDTLWTRIYGGTSIEAGSSVQQTSDGGYIIVGVTQSFGAGSSDVYLVKTDAGGNAIAEEFPTRHFADPTRLLVQPNPFTSFARVPGHETELFAFSDVTGRQVAVCKGDRIGEGLRPGVYFLSPVGLGPGKAVTATIVKTAF